jgi:hypothetical protein
MVDPHFVAALRERYDLTDPQATEFDTRTANEKTRDDIVRLTDALQGVMLRVELLEAALRDAGVTV